MNNINENFSIVYEKPMVEVMEISIEKGFANSFTEGLSGEKDPINW